MRHIRESNKCANLLAKDGRYHLFPYLLYLYAMTFQFAKKNKKVFAKFTRLTVEVR